MSIGFVDPPFGPAVARRGILVRLQVTERASGAAWTPKDISGSRYVYRLRAWDPAAASGFTVNAVVTKSATAAADGWLDHYQALGADATDALVWELVEVDTAGTDADTPTGDPEVPLLRWRQAIEASPTA